MSYILFAGLTTGVQYHAVNYCKNYSEAFADCQGRNFNLARIQTLNQLYQARNSSGYDNRRRYWTALQIM